MESVASRPALPKLAWVAAVFAFLDSGYLLFNAISGQILVVLPLALIPLMAGIGILRRTIWSARGFALYRFCGVIVALFLSQRITLKPADWIILIATVILKLLIVGVLLLVARSLARVQGRTGQPHFWIIVTVLFVLPWFFFQAFSMPSPSMENTLLTGDSMLVQRWPRPAASRGDVVVFSYPTDPHENSIKRIVGVPGDRLRIVNKILYRNGAPAIEPFAIHRTAYIDSYRDNFPSPPNVPLQPAGEDMLASHVRNGEVVVPAGKYFVMGDNRDDSLDSRYYGFVDAAAILGKPILIYSPVDRPNSGIVTSQVRGRVRWNRLFQIVR